MDVACEDQQAAYLDGDASAADHLATCPVCVHERPQLDMIRAVLDDETTWIEPPADLEARVIAAALGEGRAAETAANTAADTAWVADPIVHGRDELAERRARRERRRGTGRPVWLAAAACVLGALIGAGVVKALDRPAGFQQHVALAGTELAPQASATAHTRATATGLEIHLDVTGLPTAPAGSFYEAWLKGPEGLVPIGTFHTGNGEVTLWSAVSLDSHPTMTVTIQSDNGDPASSGKQVLVGKVGN